MQCEKITFSQHAFTRMFERGIDPELVIRATQSGEVITTYADDQPFSSFLLVHVEHGRALHLVVGQDEVHRLCYIITAYWPAPALWSPDFKTRRTP